MLISCRILSNYFIDSSKRKGDEYEDAYNGIE